MADGVVLICDRDGRVLAVHAAGDGLPGLRPYCPEAGEGMPFPALFGLEPFGRALDLFAALRRDGSVLDWPLAATGLDGVASPLYLSGRSLGDRLVLVAAPVPGAVRAVTEAVCAAQPELGGLLHPLIQWRAVPGMETLFDEMTRLNSELANTQRELAKANAALAATNAQKSRLLGMLAHDLRTPLQVISGFAQHLQGRLSGRGESRDLVPLERIRESSLFMRHLIEDVLSMSALEAGRLTVSPRPADLGALVQANVTANEILAQGKGLYIHCRVEPGLPPVALDAPRVEQVMNNLLSNAVKHSSSGGRILVAVVRDGDRVRVTVADHGRGIAPEMLGVLFQPFTRSGPLAIAGETSVGLGLFICRTIVEAHGGTIGVESVPGQGATFHFELPVSAAHD